MSVENGIPGKNRGYRRRKSQNRGQALNYFNDLQTQNRSQGPLYQMRPQTPLGQWERKGIFRGHACVVGGFYTTGGGALRVQGRNALDDSWPLLLRTVE